MTAAANHEPVRRRRGRPAQAHAKAMTPLPFATTAPTPVGFRAPSRFGLAAVLEYSVCESLNAVGVPTDCGGWLMHPGQPAEALFGRAVAHLDAALQAQHFGTGYWRADFETADDGSTGRFRLLIGDAWTTAKQAVTFRGRSVEFEGGAVHLTARNAGRRIVRLLSEAAASTLVPARPEAIH